MADEEMLEEVSIITITGEDGTEEYYLEDGEIEFDGKRFAFLTQVTETGEEMEDGEAIIARVETEDGELVFSRRQMKNLTASLKSMNNSWPKKSRKSKSRKDRKPRSELLRGFVISTPSLACILRRISRCRLVQLPRVFENSEI